MIWHYSITNMVMAITIISIMVITVIKTEAVDYTMKYFYCFKQLGFTFILS